jgi:hypothetical protein
VLRMISKSPENESQHSLLNQCNDRHLPTGIKAPCNNIPRIAHHSSGLQTSSIRLFYNRFHLLNFPCIALICFCHTKIPKFAAFWEPLQPDLHRNFPYNAGVSFVKLAWQQQQQQQQQQSTVTPPKKLRDSTNNQPTPLEYKYPPRPAPNQRHLHTIQLQQSNTKHSNHVNLHGRHPQIHPKKTRLTIPHRSPSNRYNPRFLPPNPKSPRSLSPRLLAIPFGPSYTPRFETRGKARHQGQQQGVPTTPTNYPRYIPFPASPAFLYSV